MADAYSGILTRHLAIIDDPKNFATKGVLFEDMVEEIMLGFPGVSIIARNHRTGQGSEEIDISFKNRNFDLDFLDSRFPVECKNIRHPVDSKNLGWFVEKVLHMGASVGLLFAVHGITGNLQKLTAAHMVLNEAKRHKRVAILVITREDLMSVTNYADLAELLSKRRDDVYLENFKLGA